jgi:hypothetical protein
MLGRNSFVALFAVVVLLAGSSPAKAEPAASQQQIIDRYTNTMWPATSAYNADHSQGGPASKRFIVLFDPNLPAEQFNALRDTAQGLGRTGEYDRQKQTTHHNDGLHLGNVHVVSFGDSTAALDVCYTYTDFWYVNVSDTQQAPGASDVTVALVNVNNTWFLHAMTNDHVVAGCTVANT